MNLLRRLRPLALAALVAAAGCAGEDAGRSKPSEKSIPIDLELMRQLSKAHQQYVGALLLCGSSAPGDWLEARHLLDTLPPKYHVFDEDLDLIRKFREGDEKARLELFRRGRILSALMAFSSGYDRAKWEDAHRTLMDAGEPGQILLSTTLIEILMNGQFQEIWDHVRTTLAESGPVAFDTLVAWANAQVERTPADTPIYRLEDLTQTIMGLIWFGEKSRPIVGTLSKSPKANVRRACARAIGEAMHGPSVAILVRLLAEDPEWAVRAVAAEALGKMRDSKAVAGPALLEQMKVKQDRLVLRAIIESLGTLKYEEAVPDLITALDHPNVDMANQAMTSLYHITGLRITRKEQWLQWYASAYPGWRDRNRR